MMFVLPFAQVIMNDTHRELRLCGDMYPTPTSTAVRPGVSSLI
uniref:Uncharacterized protein n=1 Tax=Anguilla anguilla TaxID=7936 RepID=A0A0E9V6I9_ANGAN